MSAKPTPRPTPHQAEVAVKVATDRIVSQSLRELGEAVLRTYFGREMNRQDEEHAPQTWHCDQSK